MSPSPNTIDLYPYSSDQYTRMLEKWILVFDLHSLHSSFLSDDCFADMGPPLYGFTAEITVSNRTCVMDQTREDACFIDDGRENDFDLHSYFGEKQGNRGLSAGRRQCRFTRTSG